MGVWGTPIFSDDIACDVRDEFKQLINEGNDTLNATDSMIERWKDILAEPDEAPVFWLALAATQWKVGRLDERIKNKALSIIENGDDLLRWYQINDSKLIKQRERVLLKLKKQLNQPQCPPRKLTKRFVAATQFEPGDAVSYQLLSGKYIIFRVISIIEQVQGDRYPLFEICDWVGNDIPSKYEIDYLPLKAWTWENGKKEITKLAIFPSGKRDNADARLKVVAKHTHIHLDCSDPYSVLPWKSLDEMLKEYYYFS